MSALPHLWEDGADQALCLHMGVAQSRGVVRIHRAWVLAVSERVLGALSYVSLFF